MTFKYAIQTLRTFNKRGQELESNEDLDGLAELDKQFRADLKKFDATHLLTMRSFAQGDRKSLYDDAAVILIDEELSSRGVTV
jgi:hypothetical protein